MSRSLFIAVLALGSGCAHVATLRPAPKGAVEAVVELGGPVLKQGSLPIPAAVSSVGLRYGGHERADFQVHFHPTAALLGVLGFDAGTSILAVDGAGLVPTVTATVRALCFTDFRVLRSYVQLGAVASWRLFERFSPYVGFEVIAAGPYYGVSAGLQAGFGRLSVQLEGKWFSVPHDFRALAREWFSPTQIGPFGVQLGVGYRLGS